MTDTRLTIDSGPFVRSDVTPQLSRFVGLDECDAPQLLRRMTADDLPVDGERYGVLSRLIALPGVSVVGLAEAALGKLAAATGVRPADWAAIVLSSRLESVQQGAFRLTKRLAPSAVPVGVERACSGFPAATAIAMEICRQQQRPVAIVTAEIISTSINWEAADGNLADQQRARGQASKLFADGAAAVLVQPASLVETTGSPSPDETSVGHAILDAWVGEVPDDKQLIQKLDVPDAWDPWGNPRPGTTPCVSMPGRRGFLLFKRAPRVLADAVVTSLQRTGRSADELVAVVPHQANGLIMDALEEELAQRLTHPCRVWNCFRDTGNTVSASIPLAMNEVQDRLPATGLIALPSVGAGGPGYRPDVLSTGCVLLRAGSTTP
jgi:beta-ketoacyl ACP synthase